MYLGGNFECEKAAKTEVGTEKEVWHKMHLFLLVYFNKMEIFAFNFICFMFP